MKFCRINPSCCYRPSDRSRSRSRSKALRCKRAQCIKERVPCYLLSCFFSCPVFKDWGRPPRRVRSAIKILLEAKNAARAPGGARPAFLNTVMTTTSRDLRIRSQRGDTERPVFKSRRVLGAPPHFGGRGTRQPEGLPQRLLQASQATPRFVEGVGGCR